MNVFGCTYVQMTVTPMITFYDNNNNDDNDNN